MKKTKDAFQNLHTNMYPDVHMHGKNAAYEMYGFNSHELT